MRRLKQVKRRISRNKNTVACANDRFQMDTSSLPPHQSKGMEVSFALSFVFLFHFHQRYLSAENHWIPQFPTLIAAKWEKDDGDALQGQEHSPYLPPAADVSFLKQSTWYVCVQSLLLLGGDVNRIKSATVDDEALFVVVSLRTVKKATAESNFLFLF